MLLNWRKINVFSIVYFPYRTKRPFIVLFLREKKPLKNYPLVLKGLMV